MSDNSGLAAVHAAAESVSRTDHEAALTAAREQARKEGVAAGQAEGMKAGADAERARLAGIEAAALPGHDQLVAQCKADPACTPGDAALRINAAERAKLGAQHQAIKDVEGVTGKVAAAPSATQTSAGPATTVAQNAEGWKAEYVRSEQLQGEFASADAYANYMDGVKSGRIRVLGTKR